MKKIIPLLLTVIILFTACTKNTDIPSTSPTPSVSAVLTLPVPTVSSEPELLYRQLNVDYTLSEKLPEELADHIKEQRKNVFVKATDAGEELFKSWLDEGPTSEMDESVAKIVRGIVAEGEPKMKPETITKEDAQEEIAFLFDYMKCAYSGYGYFGGDPVFLPIRDEMLKSLELLTQIDGYIDIEVYENLLIEPLQPILIDAHFSINNNGFTYGNMLYYAANEELAFQKDGDSYKTMLDGEEYILISIDGVNPAPYVKATLLEDGSFAYILGKTFSGKMITEMALEMGLEKGPVTYWEKPLDVLLKRNNEEKHISMKLKFYTIKKEENIPIYRSYEKNGVMVLENKMLYPYDSPDLTKMNSLSETEKFKNQKTVIIDIMGNGGGNSDFVRTWMHSFLPGQGISEGIIWTIMRTSTAQAARSYWNPNPQKPLNWINPTFMPPKLKKNDTITFLLMGGNASAGETWVSYLRETDNVIMVGINSMGCFQFADVSQFYLPYSKLYFQCGTSLCVMNQDFSQFEFVGYEPDLWIDPTKALERVSRCIELYGLND